MTATEIRTLGQSTGQQGVFCGAIRYTWQSQPVYHFSQEMPCVQSWAPKVYTVIFVLVVLGALSSTSGPHIWGGPRALMTWGVVPFAPHEVTSLSSTRRRPLARPRPPW